MHVLRLSTFDFVEKAPLKPAVDKTEVLIRDGTSEEDPLVSSRAVLYCWRLNGAVPGVVRSGRKF